VLHGIDFAAHHVVAAENSRKELKRAHRAVRRMSPVMSHNGIDAIA